MAHLPAVSSSPYGRSPNDESYATLDIAYDPDLSVGSHHFYQDSASIIGDFVPLDSPNMAGLTPTMDSNDPALQGSFAPFRAPKTNMYEFEPTTPLFNATHRGGDGKQPQAPGNAPDVTTPRVLHVKNALSDGKVNSTDQRFAKRNVRVNANTGDRHRSNSSPVVPQSPCINYQQKFPRTKEIEAHTYNGRCDVSASCDCHQTLESIRFQPYHVTQQHFHGHAQKYCSPPINDHIPLPSLRPDNATCLDEMISPPMSTSEMSDQGQYQSRGRNRYHRSDDCVDVPPKIRSRSPMKKMFGENGWLGRSPVEQHSHEFRTKTPFRSNTDPSQRSKMSGMMDKLRNKIEELAEKAELSPVGRHRDRVDSDRYKQSTLAVSLSPPEQARIFMEVELMIVHTANAFLMNEFSRARLDFDSMKKAIETWKSKGRPVVVEFMYDQATQRELIIANQHTVRFHGNTSMVQTRINSMLYNWKQVANIMLIRTFCSANTVITKLLFDIEQILELLGAAEPMLIRLQQIQVTTAELIRRANTRESPTNDPEQSMYKSPTRGSCSTIRNREGDL